MLDLSNFKAALKQQYPQQKNKGSSMAWNDKKKKQESPKPLELNINPPSASSVRIGELVREKAERERKKKAESKNPKNDDSPLSGNQSQIRNFLDQVSEKFRNKKKK